jgi:hypothetical protein
MSIMCASSINHHMRFSLRSSAGAVLGSFCLISLAVCVVVIPTRIKNSVGDFNLELQAREHLCQTIHANLSVEALQESAELAPVKRAAPPVACPVVNEDLRFGRVLISKGLNEAAIPYYQRYVRLDPDCIAARMELIRACIAANQKHEARVLCIGTLKKQLTSEDIGAVWQEMAQCQTD